MHYPTILRCSTVFQPIITVYVYIVKVSHDHVLLVTICNNLMHMWRHVTNHLIIFNDKDSNSENRIKLRVRDTGDVRKGSVGMMVGREGGTS
jgi:16S rRNA U1498 N3-methylase RsmE